MKATVIGSDLSGLLAAHALTAQGYEVAVYKTSEKPYENLLVQNCIPGLEDNTIRIRTDPPADAARWEEKAGPMANEFRFLAEAEEHRSVWLGSSLYPELVKKLAGRIIILDSIPESAYDADLVVSTMAPAICQSDDCVFFVEDMWRTKNLRSYDMRAASGSFVKFSSNEKSWWHTSFRFGAVEGTIYPDRKRPPGWDMQQLVVPTGTNCICRPNVVRVGPSGVWDAASVTTASAYSSIVTTEGIHS